MAVLSNLIKPLWPPQLRRGHPLAYGLVGSFIPIGIHGVDTKLRDWSGRDKHATMQGTMSRIDNPDGGGIRFPGGAGNWLDMNSIAPIVPLGEFSFVLRWRVQSLIVTQPLLQLRVTGSGNDQIDFTTSLSSAGAGANWRVAVVHGSVGKFIDDTNDVASSISIAVGASNFIGVTNSKSRDQMRVFGRNGQIGTTQTGLGTPSATPMNDARFGTDVFLSSVAQCDLFYLHIYNRALSADEVMWLYRDPFVAYKKNRLVYISTAVVGRTVDSTQALPLGGSIALSLFEGVISTLALPLTGSVSLTLTEQVNSILALPLGQTTTFGETEIVSSVLALPLGSTTVLSLTEQVTSVQALPFGGSVTVSLGIVNGVSSVLSLPLRSTIWLALSGWYEQYAPPLYQGSIYGVEPWNPSKRLMERLGSESGEPREQAPPFPALPPNGIG